MISHVSFSSLSMALRCGEQFRRRYMLGQIIPPAVSMGVGRGLHKAAEINFKQKAISYEDLPQSDMVDAARDGYVDSFKDGVFIPTGEQKNKEDILNDGLNTTLSLVKLHREEASPQLQPLSINSVESKFEIDLGLDLPLLGYIDLITDKHEIIDHKTAARSWPKGNVQSDMQPVFYTIGYQYSSLSDGSSGENPPFKFFIHVKTKKPKLQIAEHVVSYKQEVALIECVKTMITMVSKGVFLPANPGDWVCSERWCGYYNTCKYVGNGKQSTWV